MTAAQLFQDQHPSSHSHLTRLAPSAAIFIAGFPPCTNADCADLADAQNAAVAVQNITMPGPACGMLDAGPGMAMFSTAMAGILSVSKVNIISIGTRSKCIGNGNDRLDRD